MNKAELITYVAEQTNSTKKDAKEAIETVLNGIIEGLSTDNKVSLVGFGTFLLVQKNARTARNPKTGEAIDVPAKVVPKFRPSAALKDVFEDYDLDNGSDVDPETEAAELDAAEVVAE